jgi:hypothetical protein
METIYQEESTIEETENPFIPTPPNESNVAPESIQIPKIVFIVPYRDREEHLKVFAKQMEHVLEDIPKSQYKFLLVHQNDKRGFNRGAVKNIGFLYIKHMYPNTYPNMTFVFNDVDTMPRIKNYFNYETEVGVIRHFCGFTNTLGGIVCIKGSDFERINGFPNFWAWGYEDNMLQTRATSAGISIDRSKFCDFKTDLVNSEIIVSLHSGPKRTVNRQEFDRYLQNTREGLSSIQKIDCNTDANSIPVSLDLPMEVLNLTYFNTGTEEVVQKRSEHDLRNGSVPFGKIFNRRGSKLPQIGMKF